MEVIKFRTIGRYGSMGGSPEHELETHYIELPRDIEELRIAPIRCGEWEQYILIEDKDGKEIYENDKVLIRWGDSKDVMIVDMFNLRRVLEESGGTVQVIGRGE